MPRRLLAPLAAAVALTVGAGCADDVSPAVRVGDVTIGNDEFLDEVAEWVANPNAVSPDQAAAAAPGAFPAELTRQLLVQRIDFELHAQEFEAQGLELDQATRDGAVETVFGTQAQADAALEPFTDDFAQSFVDDVARQLAVAAALGEEYSVWRQQAYVTSGIEVSPRYGSWDPASGTVTAPPGPRPAAGAPPPVAEL